MLNITNILFYVFHHRFWFTSIMVRRNVLNQVTIIVLVALLLLLVIGATKSTNKTRHCLKNCHHCKRHYGDHFVSHLCARNCINHKGTFFSSLAACRTSLTNPSWRTPLSTHSDDPSLTNPLCQPLCPTSLTNPSSDHFVSRLCARNCINHKGTFF